MRRAFVITRWHRPRADGNYMGSSKEPLTWVPQDIQQTGAFSALGGLYVSIYIPVSILVTTALAGGDIRGGGGGGGACGCLLLAQISVIHVRE